MTARSTDDAGRPIKYKHDTKTWERVPTEDLTFFQAVELVALGYTVEESESRAAMQKTPKGGVVQGRVTMSREFRPDGCSVISFDAGELTSHNWRAVLDVRN